MGTKTAHDQTWFQRHPVLSTILVFIAVLLLGMLASGGGSGNPANRDPKNAQEYEDPGSGPQGAGT